MQICNVNDKRDDHDDQGRTSPSTQCAALAGNIAIRDVAGRGQDQVTIRCVSSSLTSLNERKYLLCFIPFLLHEP